MVSYAACDAAVAWDLLAAMQLPGAAGWCGAEDHLGAGAGAGVGVGQAQAGRSLRPSRVIRELPVRSKVRELPDFSWMSARPNAE
jgi:hypothetical protein